jgi:hypothetical protein
LGLEGNCGVGEFAVLEGFVPSFGAKQR